MHTYGMFRSRSIRPTDNVEALFAVCFRCKQDTRFNNVETKLLSINIDSGHISHVCRWLVTHCTTLLENKTYNTLPILSLLIEEWQIQFNYQNVVLIQEHIFVERCLKKLKIAIFIIVNQNGLWNVGQSAINFITKTSVNCFDREY